MFGALLADTTDDVEGSPRGGVSGVLAGLKFRRHGVVGPHTTHVGCRERRTCVGAVRQQELFRPAHLTAHRTLHHCRGRQTRQAVRPALYR